MTKGNIYWFTGQPAHGKTVLGKKLVELLRTEKRNWRKNVFHLDGDDLRELTINKDYSEQGRINNIRNGVHEKWIFIKKSFWHKKINDGFSELFCILHLDLCFKHVHETRRVQIYSFPIWRPKK